MKSGNAINLYCLFAGILLNNAQSSTYGTGCGGRSPKWKDFGGDYCYLVEKIRTANFMDAVYNCYSAGGSLASFHSTEEVRRVVSHINRKRLRYYIGLWKLYDGSLAWVDKSSVDFRNWKDGEPNSGDERCVEMYYHSGKWNDVDCNTEMGYICSSPKSQPSTDQRKVCPYNSLNWSNFGGDFCYIIETEHRAKWTDAQDRCTAEGGSLASFHSIEEISSILQHTKAYDEMLYIGLRQISYGIYEWIDSSPLDLEYWQSGEGSNAVQICAEMNPHHGQWSKVSCKRVSGYICSAPKGDCGGAIFSDSGNIYSPYFPVRYEPNQDCIWNITVPQGHRVALEFQTFDMEYGSHCMHDFVEVFDGHGLGSPTLGKFCGFKSPFIVRSSANKMAIRFLTDDSDDGLGFAAKFTKVQACGGRITGESGYIESPNTPDEYGPGEMCVWKITVPQGKKILLRFFTFEVQYSLGCTNDVVEIHDNNASRMLGRLCGSELPPSLLSSGNEMTVTFQSDLSQEAYGFVAQFQEVSS